MVAEDWKKFAEAFTTCGLHRVASVVRIWLKREKNKLAFNTENLSMAGHRRSRQCSPVQALVLGERKRLPSFGRMTLLG
jgi:hypothetical protein